jgi:hypothetical protein
MFSILIQLGKKRIMMLLLKARKKFVFLITWRMAKLIFAQTDVTWSLIFSFCTDCSRLSHGDVVNLF